MRPTDLESLPPDIERLLESEKSRPDPPSDMRSRVLEKIGADLFDIGPPPGPSGGAGSPAGAAPSAAAPASLLRRLPMAVTLVAAGGIGGATLHAVLQQPAPAPIAAAAPPVVAPAPVEPMAAPAVPAVSAPPTKVEPRQEVPASRRQVVTAPRPPAAASPTALQEKEQQLARDAALAAERALLEQARTALARGKPGDALGVLYRHEREFARGQLVEERKALVILCLAADGQGAAARGLAAKFKQGYPNSMMQRTIDDALGAGR